MTVGPATSSVLPPYAHPPAPSASSPRGVHIGVLALQGAFHEHLVALRRLDPPSPTLPIVPRLVKTIPDLAGLHGLIIPGGESTAISLLAQSQHVPGTEGSLLDHLRSWVRSGKRATWGTCAGMILLADEVVEGSMKRGGQDLIGGLAIKVVRNQWGRQTESFEYPLDVPSLLEPGIPFPGIFIRAPVVHTLLAPTSTKSPPVETLATVPLPLLPAPPPSAPTLGPDAHVVAVKQGSVMASSNHPELSGDARFHEMWVRDCVLVHWADDVTSSA